MEVCIECDEYYEPGIYQCKNCTGFLCIIHKVDHICQLGESSFTIIRNLSSEVKRNILKDLMSKIEIINECQVTILDNTNKLLGKIKRMCNQTLNDLNEMRRKYKILLQTCENAISEKNMEEIEKELNTSLVIQFPRQESKEIEKFYKFDFLKKFLRNQTLQETTIKWLPRALDPITQNSMCKSIVDLYPQASLEFQGSRLEISAKPEDIQEIIDKMQNLMTRLDFGSNTPWAYLDDFGQYTQYNRQTTEKIECRYQEIFHELISPSYTNYTRYAEFVANNIEYELQFARIGGLHRQFRRNNSTVRAVKRQANGEDLDKNLVKGFTWMFKDETGQFKNYEDDAVFLIEQSYIEWKKGRGNKNEENRTTAIQGSDRKTYVIKFTSMMQYSKCTETKRSIKRMPSNS